MVEFHFDKSTQTLLCRFEGRMDTVMSGTVTEAFNAQLNGLKDKTEMLKIVFDIKGVDYVASSFLRLSLLAAKGVQKGNFSILNAAPQVLNVFQVARLSSLLNVS
jgi:anti-anti-sigma factor